MRFFIITILAVLLCGWHHNVMAGDVTTCPSVVECEYGYYGTAVPSTTSSTTVNSISPRPTGCTICPSNATCTGGNNSIFRCNNGYYTVGNGCTRCPAYPDPDINGSVVYGATRGTSGTSITDCYIPAGTQCANIYGTYIVRESCSYGNTDSAAK